jgi:succinate dehydrogenase/fumarate reductase flavoprotein subunit
MIMSTPNNYAQARKLVDEIATKKAALETQQAKLKEALEKVETSQKELHIYMESNDYKQAMETLNGAGTLIKQLQEKN